MTKMEMALFYLFTAMLITSILGSAYVVTAADVEDCPGIWCCE